MRAWGWHKGRLCQPRSPPRYERTAPRCRTVHPMGATGTVLSVWAHPDDETYLAGAIMADAVRGGSRVVCVTATRGELGSSDPERWPPGAPLAELRTWELEKAL